MEESTEIYFVAHYSEFIVTHKKNQQYHMCHSAPNEDLNQLGQPSSLSSLCCGSLEERDQTGQMPRLI